jgi:S1-C subfamily serine protease
MFTATCLVVTRNGHGTGFFVGDRANVVTARHVVCKDKPGDSLQDHAHLASDGRPAVVVCWVLMSGNFFFSTPAEIVREDRRTDLALLRLKNTKEFPRPLSLESLTSLSPCPAMFGDFVYFDAFRFTPRDGFECRRVQARVKRVGESAQGSRRQRFLTLDAKAWPGSSGSPVFSKAGPVIGVLTNRSWSGEAMVRDIPCVRELFRSTVPVSLGELGAVSLPFAPLSFARYSNETWWDRVRRV